jgi:hypothetical protein
VIFIYKITNKINGKAYIGQTCGSVAKRWREISASNKGRVFSDESRAKIAAANKAGEVHKKRSVSVMAIGGGCGFFFNSIAEAARVLGLPKGGVKPLVSAAGRTSNKSSITKSCKVGYSCGGYKFQHIKVDTCQPS